MHPLGSLTENGAQALSFAPLPPFPRRHRITRTLLFASVLVKDVLVLGNFAVLNRHICTWWKEIGICVLMASE